MNFTGLGLIVLTTSAMTGVATAEPTADIELDPLAYALGGTSVHVGIHEGHIRGDLGAFSLDVPEAFHGNEGFALSMAGAGAKVDYFPFSKRSGFFAGVEASFAKTTVIEEESRSAVRRTNLNLGVRAGYRIDLTDALFLSPWVGVGYATGDDVLIAGKTFKHTHLTLFPTVHVGYKF